MTSLPMGDLPAGYGSIYFRQSMPGHIGTVTVDGRFSSIPRRSRSFTTFELLILTSPCLPWFLLLQIRSPSAVPERLMDCDTNSIIDNPHQARLLAPVVGAWIGNHPPTCVSTMQKIGETLENRVGPHSQDSYVHVD